MGNGCFELEQHLQISRQFGIMTLADADRMAKWAAGAG